MTAGTVNVHQTPRQHVSVGKVHQTFRRLAEKIEAQMLLLPGVKIGAQMRHLLEGSIEIRMPLPQGDEIRARMLLLQDEEREIQIRHLHEKEKIKILIHLPQDVRIKVEIIHHLAETIEAQMPLLLVEIEAPMRRLQEKRIEVQMPLLPGVQIGAQMRRLQEERIEVQMPLPQDVGIRAQMLLPQGVGIEAKTRHHREKETETYKLHTQDGIEVQI